MAHQINQSIKNTFLSKRNNPIQEKLQKYRGETWRFRCSTPIPTGPSRDFLYSLCVFEETRWRSNIFWSGFTAVHLSDRHFNIISTSPLLSSGITFSISNFPFFHSASTVVL